MEWASSKVLIDEDEHEEISPELLDAGLPAVSPALMAQQESASSAPPPPAFGAGAFGAQPANSFAFGRAPPSAAPFGAAAPGARSHPVPSPAYRVRKSDTNVFAVKFAALSSGAAQNISAAPVGCTSCRAALSTLSTLDKKEGGAEDSDQYVWKCQFCGTANEVTVPVDQVPYSESVEYILSAPSAASPAASGPAAFTDEVVNRVFCIDTSGSMCVTQEVRGKLRLRGDRTSDLARLNTERADQYLPGQRRDVTYVSRLQAVQAAVDAQLESLAQSTPNARVGIVTFNNDVSMLGDGSADAVTVPKDALADEERLRALAGECSLAKPVKETRSALSTRVFGLEEGGATALGPALVTAISLASTLPRSSVVLCTDGLANVGLGSLDSGADREDAERFYARTGEWAKEKGVTVTVVSIKGTDCRMEDLGAVADATGGQVNIVDPLELTREFSNAMAVPVIATNVQLTIFMHRALYLRNESGDPNRLVRDVGNVTSETEMSFEFGTKPLRTVFSEEELKSVESVPFQVQITYKALDGSQRVRVLCSSRPITKDRAEAERDARVDLLAANAAQQAARMASTGMYQHARVTTMSNALFLNRIAKSEEARQVVTTWTGHVSELDSELQQAQRSEAMSGEAYDESEALESVSRARKSKRADGTAKAIYKAKATPSSMFSRSPAPPKE